MTLYIILSILSLICAVSVLVIGLMFADEPGRTEKRYRLFFFLGILTICFFIGAKIMEFQ